MQRTPFGKLALLLVLIGALALAGCGGDTGVNQSVHDQTLQDLEDERRMAEMIAAERKAIADAIAAATVAVGAVGNASTDAQVSAAEAAIAAATKAIADAANVSDDEKATDTTTVTALMTQLGTAKTARQMAMDDAAAAERMAAAAAQERTAIANAIAAAQTAVGAVDNDSSDAVVMAAETAITAATQAIAGAGNISDTEKAANTATVASLTSQLTTAKSSRQMAMDAAAAAVRMANIAAAEMTLETAEAALMGLAADASDEDRLAAQRAVQNAATELVTVLRANDGEMADIDAAIGKAATARQAADALAKMIMDQADAAQQERMAAIETAQTALSGAQQALMDLAEDATDQAKYDAQRAVQMAAAELIMVLEANEGTAAQIAAATATRDSAEMMADGLHAMITEAAEAAAAAKMLADQRQAIMDAIADAREKINAVGDDASDAEVMAADDAIAALRMAVAAASAVPETETTAHTGTVNALAGQLADAKADRQTAMRLAEEETRRQEEARQAEEARLAKIQEAKDTIAAAATKDEAEAAFNAVVGVVDGATPAEAAELRRALAARIDELDEMAQAEAKMARAEAQKMALMTAAGNVDVSDEMTAEEIAAAKTAIYALEMALTNAVDVSDADKAMYQSQVATAKMAVMTSQSALDHAAQMMALNSAVTALQAIDLSGLMDEDAIDAAEAAIADLRMALEAGTALSDAEKAAAMAVLATASRTVMMAADRVTTASQQMMLTDAHNALQAIDLNNLMTQDDIDAAERAIIALDQALADATNLTAAQKLDATADVTIAKRRVASAQTTLDGNIQTQRMAITQAAATLAALDLDDLDTAEKVAAAKAAVAALEMALSGATHLSDADKAMYQTQHDTADETVKMAETGMGLQGRRMAQRTAITDAETAAGPAVSAVDDDASEAQVSAADKALADLKAAIDAAEDGDLGEDDTNVIRAKATLAALEDQLDSRKTSRTNAMAAADRQRNMAMAATAKKLYDGISAQSGASDGSTFTATDRDAFYNNDATDVLVVVGNGTDVPSEVSATLSEDKKTPVAANHGWEGKRYIDPAGGDSYEAVVYSNIEATMGRKFGSAAAVTPTGDFEYMLDDGMLTITSAHATRVVGSSFDHTAGVKQFKLPSPNPTGVSKITFSGMFHGVSGTYTCTPGTGMTCAAQVATDGFTLGLRTDADGSFDATGTAWTFRPSDPNARVTDPGDLHYASYGWWLKKSSDGETYTASAFTDEKGTVDAAEDLDALNGKATYRGGAAGKYSLSSILAGGTNDAGHFTARATLEANFTENTEATAITGTLDQFMGADGMPRDWTVKLNGSTISDAGVIGDSTDGTEWTIGGTAAADDGQWSGMLRDNGDDGVPQVATGTFFSTYDTAGKMVGAFGATKQ